MNDGNCTFEGCRNKAHAKELCQAHWRQQHDGKELKPLRQHKRFARPAPGLKICTRCERVLSVEDGFYKRYGRSVLSWCKECMKETNGARHAKNKAAAND